MSEGIASVAVVGGGTMGGGIAHVLARHGYPVVLCETSAALADRARAGIERNLEREVKKEKLTAEQARQALARIRTTTELSEAAAADLIIEAIPERRELKTALFERLDGLAPERCLFASNTSSLSITELAAHTRRPERFIGMHFMNPVPVMPLVEVVRGLATSDETFAAVRDLALRLEKTPVEARDFPGFVSNRVLMPMINEAIFCVMEGVASAEAVDQVMKLGMNHPMGPLTLADFIGLDVCLDIMEVLYRGFHDSKYRPCPLLRQMVAAGWLGRKTGRGFYR
ncbi:MAG TPA: 3-hydroxybutyryl-CoA dehydrogenase, partial [Terriglobia bacterium]|nr:3-hydroxybutyryl-CoA dehydrogenase [Terriglobia bacterium]